MNGKRGSLEPRPRWQFQFGLISIATPFASDNNCVADRSIDLVNRPNQAEPSRTGLDWAGLGWAELN